MNSNDFDRMTAGLANTTSRRQALKLMAGGILGGAAMTAGIKGATAQPSKSQRGPTGGPGSLYWPLVGTLDGEEFVGQLQITRFSNKGGALTASGNVYDSANAFVSTFTSTVDDVEVAPVAAVDQNKIASAATGTESDVSRGLAQTSGDCGILYLTLGPIFLDVLGLVVEVPQPIVIDIYADQGGGLLGDLLCAVAGLLDSGSPLEDLLGQLTGLLNQILGALGGL